MPLILEGRHSDITRMTRLEIKRRHLGWTIFQLAWRSGVSTQTIKKHEQGVRNTYTFETVQKLTNAFCIAPSELVRGTQDIWEGGGTFWRKRLHLFDRWEEILSPLTYVTPIRTIPTATTSSNRHYWTSTFTIR